MIIIESIRLRNFRAIREAFFEPKEEGITGIFGPNGAGKTTFLSGAMFALFGELPPNSTKDSLRRTHSGQEECSASVLFTHLGQQIEVIRELKGKSNNTAVNIYVDGIPQTVDSVGTADKWITSRIGLDAKGFLTAFIVRQKELDALVNAKPAERKQIIERLAGIEAINDALKKARKDENVAKEVLGNIPGSERLVAEAESQVLLLNGKVEEVANEKNTIQEKLISSQKAQKDLANSLEAMRTQENNLFRSKTLVDSLTRENELLSSQIERVSYVKDIEEDFDIESLRARHRSISEGVRAATDNLNAGRVKATGIASRISDTQEAIPQLETIVSNSQVKDLSATDLLNEKESLNKKIESLNDTRSSALARSQDLLNSVSTLQHNTDCPTCHTHLKDPASLIESLNSMAANFKTEAEDAKNEINKARLRVAELESSLREINTLEQNKSRLEELRNQLATLLEEQKALPDLSVYETEIENLNVEKDKVTELGNKARNILEDRNTYTSSTKKQQQNEQTINENQRIVLEIQKSYSASKMEEIRTQLNHVERETNLINSQLNDNVSELSTLQSRLTIANSNYKSSVEQWKRKKDLLEAQEKKALTTELIDKFRRESIASLTPELSEYATELISDITNGAYTEIRLDEEFKLSVINANGDERNVGWLSGGEESAVAFALRLAIAFLITGGAPDLLWLDEPLTAQDQDRRMSMLTTIRNLPIKQIIMINHAGEAGDITDKSVTVIPDIKNGSVLDSEEKEIFPDSLEQV